MSREESQFDLRDERGREFVRLFSAHESRLRGYILRLVPNWNDADDIFSETNVRLWEQFDQYDRDRDFGSWACSIAHFMILAHRTRQARQRRLFSDETLEVLRRLSRHGTAEEQASEQALLTCLGRTSQKNRELLEAVYATDLTTKEVAAQLGRSAASVYMSLSRIRHWLHKCIRNVLAEEERS